MLRERARLLSKTRRFFERRGVLEVETPLLSHAGVTDPHIASFRVGGLFLQTSPEYAMKRLLCAGSGSIFQIARAFRADESGSRHNPEFTLLEWYRVGFDHEDLMGEVSELLAEVVGTGPCERASYRSIFERTVGLDPHEAERAELEQAATRLELDVASPSELEKADWLNLLMAERVEPELPREPPMLVFDFPVELAALARVRAGTAPVAERFELYWRGMELANGYHELTDAREQRERFERDADSRRALGLPEVAPDERLLDAMEAGLPDCAGVALGVDRLVMAATGASELGEVMAFPIDRA